MKIRISYRQRVLIFLFFLLFITYLDRVCISLVGVRIKSEFHLNNEQFGWILGAFALAYACFEIPSGMLGDRIGQRAVFIRIVLWWSAFTALTGATNGFFTLLITRFLFGMGESGAFPTSSGAIARWFPSSENSRSVSVLFIGQSTGAAFAPFIIIPLAVSFGWRVPFYVIGVAGLIWVFFCWWWFRNEPSEMKHISLNEKTLIELNRSYSKHSKNYSIKLFLKSRNLWSLILAFFCSQWALYFIVAWMPVYLQQGRHLSENNMKLATSYLYVIGIAASLTAGLFSDWLIRKRGLRFSRRFIGVLSLGIIGVCFSINAIVNNNTVAVVALITSYLFLMFFGITAFSTCVDIGGEKAGTIAGIMNFTGQIGAFLLAIIFGKLVDVLHSYNRPLLLIAGILFIGAIRWAAVDATKKIDSELVDLQTSKLD